jgi:hypothetical protein
MPTVVDFFAKKDDKPKSQKDKGLNTQKEKIKARAPEEPVSKVSKL